MKRILIALMTAALAAGCASTDKKEEAAAVEERTPAPVTRPAEPAKPLPAPEAKPVAPEGVRSAPLDPLKDPNNILSKRSIFFDYDSFVVKDEFRPLVEAHARYLLANRGAKVVVQGNTDERGSREYNLALGQKRSDAVRKMMQVLGVSDAQIETVSFGEEKPRAAGSSDEARAQNRRADIVYAGE